MSKAERRDDQTVPVTFSLDGSLYYVEALDHHRPKAWLGVEPNGVGQYDVLPFAFYEIKTGQRERRPQSDPLVLRYAESQGWPARGSEEWSSGVRRSLVNAERSREEARRSLSFWDNEVARLNALLAPATAPDA